ncbi:Gfo/Idh/MocA family oxidoreductase [bacterium]|nr:Gfo/Idh/MocA family oxidoreductase [bacterium]
MEKVRIGIIGMGNMGQYHASYLQNNDVSRAELVAVGSTSPDKLSAYAEKGIKVFASGEEMIKSGEIDAIVIATPHFQHSTLGIAAFEAGIHVMVEKPIAAHKADAEKLIACAEAHPNLKFAAMFQMRAEPRYSRIRKLIQDGELGDIVRINWIITDWFRSEAYYQSSGWRATWKGEGGGVLLNQCLHQLDTLQWLVGMPKNVRGFCQLGRYHDIEVEDNVSVFMEWANGATGVFVSSTGEAPGSNRFEIAGTKGKVVLESDKLTFTRNEVDMVEWNKTSKIGFVKPEIWNIELPIGNAEAPHCSFMQNFVDAILDDSELNAPGADGIHSVELANVMLLSSLKGETVDLPMDSAVYEAKLNELITGSTLEKKVVEVSNEDFSKSFNR